MRFTRRLFGVSVAAAAALTSGLAFAQAKPAAKPAATPAAAKPLQGQVVKMVRIDALSGLLGPVGSSQLKGYQFFAEKMSAIKACVKMSAAHSTTPTRGRRAEIGGRRFDL